jgi:hypothetical protein
LWRVVAGLGERACLASIAGVGIYLWALGVNRNVFRDIDGKELPAPQRFTRREKAFKPSLSNPLNILSSLFKVPRHAMPCYVAWRRSFLHVSDSAPSLGYPPPLTHTPLRPSGFGHAQLRIRHGNWADGARPRQAQVLGAKDHRPRAGAEAALHQGHQERRPRHAQRRHLRRHGRCVRACVRGWVRALVYMLTCIHPRLGGCVSHDLADLPAFMQ